MTFETSMARFFCMLMLGGMAGAAATPSASELVARFKAEQVFWQQADLGDELAEVATLRDLAPLEPWLKHDDRHARGNVAYLFAKLGDRRGFDTLVAILGDHSAQRTIQPPMIETGVVQEGAAEVDPLAEWRRNPEALKLQITTDRYYAVHLLGRLRDPRAVDVLVPLLEGDEVAYNAAWALGELGDARAISPLIHALSSKDAVVRVNAIGSLVKLHATQALPQLAKLFDDTEVPHAGSQVPVGTTARQAADSIRRNGAR